ncbi:hypothetical protein FPQ18DRAFT_392852 [Pyronema domesticum]|nr:hypothetical protein FPQ18DRAFT_392852 [Pyronema domesticum]
MAHGDGSTYSRCIQFSYQEFGKFPDFYHTVDMLFDQRKGATIYISVIFQHFGESVDPALLKLEAAQANNDFAVVGFASFQQNADQANNGQPTPTWNNTGVTQPGPTPMQANSYPNDADPLFNLFGYFGNFPFPAEANPLFAPINNDK